jgi:hypothetical protein
MVVESASALTEVLSVLVKGTKVALAPPKGDSNIPMPATQVTYSSWADEVEAADL